MRTQRIDLKYVGVAPIVGGVDQDFKIVVKVLRQVPTKLGRHYSGRIRILAENAKVDCMAGVKNPNFRLLGGHLTLVGLALPEVPDGRGRVPEWISQRAVQHRGALDSSRLSNFAVRLCQSTILAAASVHAGR